jgi:hypothetical protein
MSTAGLNSQWTDDESLLEAHEIEAGLSTVLGAVIEEASPEEVEQWIDEAASRLSPSESFDVGKALRQIGKAVGGESGLRQFAGQVLPAAGTAAGTIYGGPAGAAIGSQLGRAAGQAVAGGSPKPPQQAATPSIPVPVGGSAGLRAQPRIQAAAGVSDDPTASGSKAAGQLVHVIQNPAFLASLLSLVMGSHGRTSVPVAGKEVPVAAFMNLLGTLAGQAAQGAQTTSMSEEEEIPAYLTDADGTLLVDPVDPVQRANVLLRLLEEDSQALLLYQEDGDENSAEYLYPAEGWDYDL